MILFFLHWFDNSSQNWLQFSVRLLIGDWKLWLLCQLLGLKYKAPGSGKYIFLLDGDDYFKKNPAQDLFLKFSLDNLDNKKKTNV